MTERWESMARLGFTSYEASTMTVWRRDGDGIVLVSGGIRSVDRKVGDRWLTGRVLTGRLSNRGYVLLNLTDDNGRKVTRTPHTLILGTFEGLPEPGQEARHLNDDPLDCRWAPGETREERMGNGGNLMYGTPPENAADKVANGNRSPARPREAKRCVRCNGPFMGNGRRCHACVVWIGETAAQMLSAGTTLAGACEQLEYPSPEGLHTLAVKYGGYGLRAAPRPDSWLRRVIATLRDWLELGDGQ
jgi:hypothetical protein